MPEAWNSCGGSPGWGIDVSTASEQPGPGLPEEPVESVEPADGPAEEEASAAAAAADPAAREPEPSGEEPADRAGEPETEEERVARERVEFDKLVAAFHSESAPDPQPKRPESPAPR